MTDADAHAAFTGAQRAAGVIAARHRGDLVGADELLAAFPDEAARTRGFLLLAELALTILRSQSGQSMDGLVRELTLHIAYLGQLCRRHEASAIRPLLGPDHPLVRFGPPAVPRRPRSWYLRTGDPAGLLTRLTPLLRARWRAAGLSWPEPTMTIDTYGRAARLAFTGGELTSVTAVRGAVNPSMDPAIHAAIPSSALLQLALGHRTLPEVLDIWPDCLPRDRLTEQFLTAAFPRVPVQVWPRT